MPSVQEVSTQIVLCDSCFHMHFCQMASAAFAASPDNLNTLITQENFLSCPGANLILKALYAAQQKDLDISHPRL